MAKTMVEMSPQLRKFVKPYRRSLVVRRTRSMYRVVSAEAKTKHGPNISGIVFDELHVQPNRELWDTLTAGVASRKQPLIVAITTAGYDRESICWEQHEYAQRVIRNPKTDTSFLGVIFAAGEKDDWTSPKTWAKANKSLGTTITKEYLAGECARAKQSPAYQNTFQRLHLNIWTSQEERWIPMEAWNKCGQPVDVESLKGKACYGGLDLASSVDIAALVLDFPDEDGNHTFLPFFWVPAANIRERGLKDRVDYEVWARQGYITATPGNVIDYAHIRAKVEELAKTYDLREVAFDRWGAVQITQELSDAGITVAPFGQGYASMTPPTKELLKLLLSGKIRHGGNPVMSWMADNVMVRQDPAGNIKPDKARSREKIDGIVAMIMALDRAMRDKSSSIFDDPNTSFV
jgi:phage terminase large subunit-like protein